MRSDDTAFQQDLHCFSTLASLPCGVQCVEQRILLGTIPSRGSPLRLIDGGTHQRILLRDFPSLSLPAKRRGSLSPRSPTDNLLVGRSPSSGFSNTGAPI